jgi:hypothetical protein
MITINAVLVTAITGALIPIAVGLVTHSKASSRFKSLLSVVLNAIQALIVSSVISDGSALISKDTLILWVMGVVTSTATYIGVWKPTELIKVLLPNFGLGGPTAAPEAVSAPSETPPVDSVRSDLPA